MDYLMSQGVFVYADGSPAGVSGYTAMRDILMNNWGTEIQTYGDSIENHHHFMIYDGTWKRYDNGPDAGYPDYQMYALDHMIIDRNFYPSTWRSGWNIMPTALSNWLEQWIPFDYTPYTGNFTQVHPTGMNRWQVRTSTGVSETSVIDAFMRARDYGSAIYSFYTHTNENMVNYVNSLQGYLNTADANEALYPNVTFKYVSAREAMQLALGFTDFTPPTFTVTSSGSTYKIKSSEPLWANHPYVVLKYKDGTYMHVTTTPTGTNTWNVTPTAKVDENVARYALATASSYEGSHSPEIAIDGTESTSNYWGTNTLIPAGQVPQWLKLDLGSPINISKITTHFYDGDARTYTYYIEISNDGSTWTTLIPSKTGSGSVTDAFPEVKTRTIRITVTNNTANKAAHIEEIKVYHVTSTPLPLPLPSPETIGIAASDLYGNPGVLVTHAPVSCYLTLATSPTGVAQPVGEGRYDAGAYGSISTNEYVYNAPSTRYRFNGWTTADMAKITNASAASTTVLMDKNKTVTANYVLQHRLTFGQTGLDASATGQVATVGSSAKTYANLPFSIWVDNGNSVSYSYEANVPSSVSGKRCTLDTVSGQQSPIIVRSPTNVTGNYVTQYYLTATPPYDTPSGQGWYNAGSNAYATLANGTVSGGTGIRYVFTGWSGDASGTDLKSNAITMNSAKTATANYKTQYYLGVVSSYGTVSGMGWYDSGATAYATVTPLIVDGSTGVRYVFTNWSGNSSGTTSLTDTITMNAPKTATANYREQFWIVFQQTGVPTGSIAHVTVNSVQHILPYSEWFDQGSTVNFTYEEIVPGATVTRYVLDTMSGQAPLSVENPITMTGYYKTEYTNKTEYTTELIVLILSIIVLSGLATATIFLKRRKAKTSS